MSKSIKYLSSLPSERDFYELYWNKMPFIVKEGIDQSILSELIDANELAGLSLEEDVRSRIVQSESWSCAHGPFEENVFLTLGENNWSLLVQDVEKFHPPTAGILKPFGFSPCWLIDDVMVSYAVPGGGVGPHLDSYHVFLVQGMGKRLWKIGRSPIQDEKLVADLDIKILEEEFDGDTVEVTAGDILYIPPKFPHAGETIDESLTYSIGFLGPSIAELFVEYGHYIEERGEINLRYAGNKLDQMSAGENMSGGEVANIRSSLGNALNSDHFDKWLRGYFRGDEV